MFYNHISDWNSDSSYTVSSQGDCESPNAQNTKNPYHQDHIFEDITPDIPMRASNPIIKDVNFKQFDEEPFDSVLQEKLFSRFNVYKF